MDSITAVAKEADNEDRRRRLRSSQLEGERDPSNSLCQFEMPDDCEHQQRLGVGSRVKGGEEVGQEEVVSDKEDRKKKSMMWMIPKDEMSVPVCEKKRMLLEDEEDEDEEEEEEEDDGGSDGSGIKRLRMRSGSLKVPTKTLSFGIETLLASTLKSNNDRLPRSQDAAAASDDGDHLIVPTPPAASVASSHPSPFSPSSPYLSASSTPPLQQPPPLHHPFPLSAPLPLRPFPPHLLPPPPHHLSPSASFSSSFLQGMYQQGNGIERNNVTGPYKVIPVLGLPYGSHHHHHRLANFYNFAAMHFPLGCMGGGGGGPGGLGGCGVVGVGGGGGLSGKRKKSWTRAVFSNLQRKGLEKRFQLMKYITKPDRRLLAASLGLTDAQVKVWFQNRRMKWRHQELKDKREQERAAAAAAATAAKPPAVSAAAAPAAAITAASVRTAESSTDFVSAYGSGGGGMILPSSFGGRGVGRGHRNAYSSDDDEDDCGDVDRRDFIRGQMLKMQADSTVDAAVDDAGTIEEIKVD